MSYDEVRDSEQLRLLDVAIAAFITRHQANPATAGRCTVFLFPGGMASRLVRAQSAYRDDDGPGQTFAYDTVWCDLDTLSGDALLLAMHKQEDGFRDLEDRIVVAHGSVEFLGCTPYDGFTAWCDARGLDWFVFGWDWRRRVEEVAAFFLEQFLPRFRQQVQANCGMDPLAHFSVIGHSFGGIVVNAVNRRDDAVLAGLHRAITVGTPFYGYGGQIHRWFEGEPFLNALGTLDVIKVISSFPGVYVLPFLDGDTYAANRVALEADPDYPLSHYPSLEATKSADADPFDPVSPTEGRRYPTTTDFDTDELQHAKETFDRLASEMPKPAVNRFYCVRGVQEGSSTAGGITWKPVEKNYDPGSSPSPLADGADVPGDDTLPAWTTRLVSLPMSQVVTVKGAVEHAFLLESSKVQDEIGGILGAPDAVPTALARRRHLDVASSQRVSTEEALQVVRTLQARQTSGEQVIGRLQATKLVEQITLGKLRAVARRVLSDVMRGPIGPRPAGR